MHADAQSTVEAELRRNTQALLDAIAPGEAHGRVVGFVERREARDVSWKRVD